MQSELNHHQHKILEPWLPFFPSLISQYRLKQLSNFSVANSFCTITASNHAFKDSYIFSIIMSDLDSQLAAAVQHLTLSDAGAEQPTNFTTTTTTTTTTTYLNPEIVFPSHVFPQFNSLKREIRHPKLSVTTMDPLDWNTGHRANRPFEHVNTDWLAILHSLSPRSFPAPPPPPSPPSRRSVPAQQPTAYYLEQAAFYSQVPGIDPFASEPAATIRPGPLKIFVFWLLSLFLSVFAAPRSVGRSAVAGLLVLLRCLSSVFVRASSSVSGVLSSVEWRWDVLIAVALAAYLLRWIPGVDVDVGGGTVMEMAEGQEGPVYTMFVSGRKAIGSGPVGDSF
ncbi:hypothetical protein BDZ45DRAFT_37473 [Acephala macrosclerotiorum]|nr:hypothetical protein BDZ45DRAFT_37473 [Acephala macrosclerotiorum]